MCVIPSLLEILKKKKNCTISLEISKILDIFSCQLQLRIFQQFSDLYPEIMPVSDEFEVFYEKSVEKF